MYQCIMGTMLMRFHLPQWLYPPTFSDEEHTRIAVLVNILIWALIIVFLLNGVGHFLIVPEINPPLWGITFVILVLLGLRWLMRKERVYLAGFGVCFMLWILLASFMTV